MRKLLSFLAISTIPLLAGRWPLEFFSSDPQSALEAAQKIPFPDDLDLYVLEYRIPEECAPH
jgi:hypothetical protein